MNTMQNVGASIGRPLIPTEYASVLTNVFAYGDGSIFDALHWIRHNEPLGIADVENYDPFWVVTRHADLREFGRRNDVFLSGEHSITLMSQEELSMMRAATNGRSYPIRGIISMDAPDHGAYRSLLSKQFLMPSIKKLEDQLRPIAREFADKLAATGGECDFAETIAFVYPLRVIMSLLGVPETDEPKMLKLTQELFGVLDPEFSRASGGEQTLSAAAQNFMAVIQDIFAYFGDVHASRLANPTDDIASLIAHSKINGEPLPNLELLSYYFLLATAGHDTTAACTAGAIVELARNPAELAKVKNDLSLCSNLVEEAIRWVTPAKMTMRKAISDVEILGRQIRAGDVIGLAWASGNRDETVFDDPYSFQSDRKANPLLAFGAGPHVCLGQHLARLEMRLLFEELLPRIEALELTGPVRSLCSFQASGPKTAPIRFNMF